MSILIAASLAAHGQEAATGAAPSFLPNGQPLVPFNDISECRLSTEEVCDLDVAASAARDYAESHPGVGILIHVGLDFPNDHFDNAHQFGEAAVNMFAQQGVQARYFLSQNDGPNTGMTYYIGPYIHGQDDGTEVKNVLEAIDAAPDVAQQLRILNPNVYY